MSAIGPVCDCYETGMKYRSEHKYAKAARYFYCCSLFYENGELPFYISQVKEYGEDAMSQYYACRKRMNAVQRQALNEELVFKSDWSKQVDVLFDSINSGRWEEPNEEYRPLRRPCFLMRVYQYIVKKIQGK